MKKTILSNKILSKTGFFTLCVAISLMVFRLLLLSVSALISSIFSWHQFRANPRLTLFWSSCLTSEKSFKITFERSRYTFGVVKNDTIAPVRIFSPAKRFGLVWFCFLSSLYWFTSKRLIDLWSAASFYPSFYPSLEHRLGLKAPIVKEVQPPWKESAKHLKSHWKVRQRKSTDKGRIYVVLNQCFSNSFVPSPPFHSTRLCRPPIMIKQT